MLGEVIVTEEVVDLPPWEEVAVLALPHATTVANAISDDTPKNFLINVNFTLIFKMSNGWPAVFPVATRHSSAELSGRRGWPKSAR